MERSERVRGTLRTPTLWRVPLTRLAASLLATLSPQAGRGEEGESERYPFSMFQNGMISGIASTPRRFLR